MSFFKKLVDKAEDLFDGDDKKNENKASGQGQGTPHKKEIDICAIWSWRNLRN